METFFSDYLNRLETLHSEIEKAVLGLTPEALDWTPGIEMNSIAILVVHLTGAERYWIGDVALGEPSGRVRQAEFQVKGMDAVALQARLSANLNYARTGLEKLTLENLKEERISPMDGKQVTVAWALLHTLDHTGLHLGQIQLTRQLWDQKPEPPPRMVSG